LVSCDLQSMARMNSTEEYEEEEETLVMAELQGIMETDYLAQITQAKILGIATDKPLLQLDDYTFSGQFQDIIGTSMFFEELPAEEYDDENTEDLEEASEEKKPKQLEFRCKTNKKLCFERIFINKIPEASKDESGSQSASEGEEQQAPSAAEKT